MSEYIVFENAGEIDPRLISAFGVNVKESDSAIGFFGTGLKYALSILARECCEVVIQSGVREHTFGNRAIEIRGKQFDFVTMDGEPMGFTTEVGKNWELWMAYRELYCNAQDENGRIYQADTIPVAMPGITRVVVSGTKFVAIASDHGKYFLTSEPMLKGLHCDIHHGAASGVYYRRVLVGALSQRPFRHTYNLTHEIALTEDRVMKSGWDVGSMIAKTVIQSDDRGFIRRCINAPEEFHEAHMDFDWGVQPSEAFMEVAESLVRDSIATTNHTAVAMYRKHRPEKKIAPPPVVLNDIEQLTLEKAKAFCAKIGFDISYPIVPVESLGENIFGMACDETIFLSHRVFMKGTKEVAATLIEEHIHLKHGLADCTRGLQNYLFDRLVSMGERVIGEPL